MLPTGSAHILRSNAGRIAKRLGIDYVPVTVDFEFGRMGAHPVQQGIIIPEESRQALLDALDEYEANEERKQEAARQKRAVANWRKFTRFLLMKARLLQEYGQGSDDDSSGIHDNM